MTNSLPVIAEALSEARNATSSATSDGLLGLLSGIPPSMSINFCRAVGYAPEETNPITRDASVALIANGLSDHVSTGERVVFVRYGANSCRS